MPNPLLLTLILLAVMVTVPVLLVRGLWVLVRGRRRAPRVLAGLARLSAGVTLAVYGWGALHLVRDETMVMDACQSVVGPSLAEDVSGYDASFVPLGFACLVPGGGRYDVFVPGYVNPTVLVLLLLTVILFVIANAMTSATSSAGGART